MSYEKTKGTNKTRTVFGSSGAGEDAENSDEEANLLIYSCRRGLEAIEKEIKEKKENWAGLDQVIVDIKSKLKKLEIKEAKMSEDEKEWRQKMEALTKQEAELMIFLTRLKGDIEAHKEACLSILELQQVVKADIKIVKAQLKAACDKAEEARKELQALVSTERKLRKKLEDF